MGKMKKKMGLLLLCLMIFMMSSMSDSVNVYAATLQSDSLYFVYANASVKLKGKGKRNLVISGGDVEVAKRNMSEPYDIRATIGESIKVTALPIKTKIRKNCEFLDASTYGVYESSKEEFLSQYQSMMDGNYAVYVYTDSAGKVCQIALSHP